jgi:signal transduction histidine kinase
MSLRIFPPGRPWVAVALFAATCMGPAVSAQPRAARTVLAIHWGPEDFPASPVVNAAIREALRNSDLPIDYFAEYLESDRFPVEEADQTLADYIRRKYRHRQIDLVIAIADPALRFVLDHRRELFPEVPIVYSGLEVPHTVDRSAGGGLTGVMRGVAYARTLQVALELHPSTERVFVVARRPDQQVVAAVRAQLHDFSRQVRLTYVNEATVPRLLAAVEAVPPGSLILYVSHTQDDAGALVNALEGARLVAGVSPVPVYGTNEAYVGAGIVGGMVRGTRETGTRIGEMALQILNGTRAQDVPMEDARLVPIFDWREVQRWRIDPTRLPEGANIRFRTPTAWESYRGYILGTAVIVTAQLLLIAGLLVQRARRRRAEETIRANEATLRTSYERIRQLAGRLINAQEEARAGIARDLHDDMCQRLAYVSMGVNSLKSSSGRIQDAQSQEALSELEHDMSAVFDGIRRLSHDLHPSTLRLLGLVPALKAHCIEVEKRHDVRVSFKSEGDLGHLDPDIAVCFFRIAQESLRNGVIHGEARQFTVSLARTGQHVELTVSDDGQGFDLEAVRRVSKGLGLVSMEERAWVVGGQVQIIAGLGQGTTIRVRASTGPSEAMRPPETVLAGGGSEGTQVPARG